MKFDNNTTTEVQKIGDIQDNNVSIDVNNIDFVVTILSTNLYSDPIGSFIREIVSNAWDSHVEANVTDPVILEIGKDLANQYFCRIQDFGTGLSPDRFNNIYKNIGSSTKRNTNGQIGMFGIGRFSALAYADVVNITSIYNGVKYIYIMYKDGNKISIDLLNESDTDERNGLEVSINIRREDIYNFTEAIRKQLVYFENLYVTDNTGITTIDTEFLNFSIKKYDNFNVNTLAHDDLNILLGKVRYPLRIENLTKEYSTGIKRYPISLRFEIGDLDVTPNREEILYSKKNIKIIKNKLDAAIKEIDDLIKIEFNKDYTDIPSYIEAIQKEKRLTLISDDTRTISISINNKRHLTLNKVSYPETTFKQTYNLLNSKQVIKFNYNIGNNKIFNVKSSYVSMYYIMQDGAYINDMSSMKVLTKRYMRETFGFGTRIIKSLESRLYYCKIFLKYLHTQENKYIHYGLERFKYDHDSTKVLLKYVVDEIFKIPTFDNNDVPQKWIDEKKAEAKEARKYRAGSTVDWKQNIKLYVLRRSYNGWDKIATEAVTCQLMNLSARFKMLTIYGERGDEKLKAFYRFMNGHVKVVEVAPTKIKLLKDIENFVNVKDAVDIKYRIIRNLGTTKYILDKVPHIYELQRIENLKSISKRLHVVVHLLIDFLNQHNYRNDSDELINEIYKLCETNKYFNLTQKSIVDINQKMLDNSKILIYLTEKKNYSGQHIPEERLNLITDYILARKLFRPNVEAVKKLREETIFNVKKDII